MPMIVADDQRHSASRTASLISFNLAMVSLLTQPSNFSKQVPHQVRSAHFCSDLILRSGATDNYAEVATMPPSPVPYVTYGALRLILSRFSVSQIARTIAGPRPRARSCI